MPIGSALQFESVSKTYGKVCALEKIDLEIKEGEKTAIIGNNGAGKSTFLNLCVGFISPTQGKVNIDPSFSYLPQTLNFPGYLKVRDVISLLEVNADDKIANDVVDALGLSRLLGRYCQALSGGETRKLAFAVSLLGRKRFLLLDEPTANVDLVSRRVMHDILDRYCSDLQKTLLFSSHDMSDVEKLAQRIVIFHKGRIVADGNVADIKNRYSPMKVSFCGPRRDIDLASALKSGRVENIHTVYTSDSDMLLRDIMTTVPDASKIEIERSSLEEALFHIWEQQ